MFYFTQVLEGCYGNILSSKDLLFSCITMLSLSNLKKIYQLLLLASIREYCELLSEDDPIKQPIQGFCGLSSLLLFLSIYRISEFGALIKPNLFLVCCVFFLKMVESIFFRRENIKSFIISLLIVLLIGWIAPAISVLNYFVTSLSKFVVAINKAFLDK